MANTSIWLHNGRHIDLMEVEKFEFTMDDFAHPLSMLNRYTGHTVAPYSVAEHSVLGSCNMLVEEEGLERAFLIHDCNEGLMNDLAHPFKHIMPEYCAFETRVQKHIFKCFDEPWENMERLKEYDRRMCQDEMGQIFDIPHNIGLEPIGIIVRFWDWSRAKEEMLTRAKELDLAI